MSADSEEGVTGLPFVPKIARRIVEELFGAQGSWKRDALVARVLDVHRERGGLAAHQNAANLVMRVLRELKDDGLVENFNPGWWRWSASASGNSLDPERGGASVAAARDDDDVADGDIGARPEKEVGAGPECVYVYFNPNDRKLAELEGRDVWECKIGRTSSNDALARIWGQGVRTALSRTPLVALVLRTEDSAALERALHSCLRLSEAEVPDAPGVEWFMTSPARIEAWYVDFQRALRALALSRSDPA